MTKTVEMKNLVLRELENSDETIYRRFFQECIDSGEKTVPGSAVIDLPDFKKWVKLKNDNAQGLNLKPDYVPSTTYFLFNNDSHKIVGVINLRHELNSALTIFGGNIGYGVIPSERRKGYASFMLKVGLEFFQRRGTKKVLVTCNSTNEGSRKTILKCGGVFENSVTTADGEQHERYWIKTKRRND